MLITADSVGKVAGVEGFTKVNKVSEGCGGLVVVATGTLFVQVLTIWTQGGTSFRDRTLRKRYDAVSAMIALGYYRIIGREEM
jgi:hypothetical protein